MDQDIVKEISEIEKEAESVVEDARKRARALESGLEEKRAPLRLEYEKQFEAKAEGLRRSFKEEVQQGEAKLKEAFADAKTVIVQREMERSDEVVSFLINRIREF